MVEIVQILDGVVKVNVSVPELYGINVNEKIGSSTLISWTRIKLPTLETTFSFNRKWLWNEKYPDSFDFKYLLYTNLKEAVRSFCYKLMKGKRLPFSELNVYLEVNLPNIPPFSLLEYTKKKKLKLLISTLMVVDFNGPVSISQFRRFLRNLIREYSSRIDSVIEDQLVSLFSMFLPEKDKFRVKCNLHSDGSATIFRRNFVPTEDPNKLRPLSEIHFELEFPGLDREVLQSLFHSVITERDPVEKLRKFSLIISLMDFDVLSCSSEEDIKGNYFIEFDIDLGTPEGLKQLVQLLVSWTRRDEDDETLQGN